MKLKKRKKSRKMRGTRLHGWAAKKHKGSGNRGGKGMAGTGKRGDQRKNYVLKNLFPYFGKPGRGREKKLIKKKEKKINLENIEKYIKNNEVNLPGYKILGNGEIRGKITVRALKFSKSAREKIEKAGGKIIELRENKKAAEKEKRDKKAEESKA